MRTHYGTTTPFWVRLFFIKTMNKKKRFTEKERKFIQQNYTKLSYRQIGDAIGRSSDSVQKYAKRIGISKIESVELNVGNENEPEIWMDIAGYDGKYKISNYGRVYSVERKSSRGRKVNAKILNQFYDKHGYKQVCLSDCGKSKKISVHALVARAFVKNPNNYFIVNHKDENKENNFYKNLEWCTDEYNVNYGTHNERESKTKGRPVLQYDLEGNLIAEYYSVLDAHKKTGISYGCIMECCGEYRKRSDGTFKHKYKNFMWYYKYKEKKNVKPIIQYDTLMNEIARYNSCAEAGRCLNISARGISDCCNGVVKKYRGYIWKYDTEN